MSKAPISEKLFLEGPAGPLEAILESPADPVPIASAVVLHPHPQHGGTMHNKVAHTLARAFVRSNFAVLRFNFRGTEASAGEFDQGVGELEDALAAIRWMRNWMEGRHGSAPFWVAGFSFGAAIAVHAAASVDPDGLISVAPAVSRFAKSLDQQPTCPWLIVQGDADELVAVDETIEWLNGLDPGPELLIMPGTEHFFHGKLVEMREAIEAYVARTIKKPH